MSMSRSCRQQLQLITVSTKSVADSELAQLEIFAFFVIRLESHEPLCMQGCAVFFSLLSFGDIFT